MFKLTDDNSTIIGCNHDAWVTEPQLKFTTLGYGAAFTGATRYKGTIAPQSGMNEHGIVFTTLAIYEPTNQKKLSGKPISDRALFLESVLQKCKSLEEVEEYFAQYDRSIFINDLFVYMDSDGRVLFVEPYLMHYYNDPTLVQSNFCPSETQDKSMIMQERFIRGNAFIKNAYSTDFSFARSMIEEMTVCRERHGDGTLISTLWDNQNLTFEVIFYHDFDSVRSYDLRSELLKGDTTYIMENMFPVNEEFEELKKYHTPFNTPLLRFLLAAIGGLSGLLGLWFIWQVFVSNSRNESWYWSIQAVAALMVFAYCFALATDIAMFYSPWPYDHPQSLWRTLIGIAPIFFCLALIVNLTRIRRIIQDKRYSVLFGSGFYLLITIGFFYWSL